MAGFFSFFLSYYVLPNYPIDGVSPAVFPLAVLLARGQPVALAPLFLGSLYHQLDLVQADYARSLGRCNHLSMAHTNFLLAYFFEHFRSIAPVPLAFQASGQRSRVEKWQGTSSNASWYEACDIEANLTPRPYNIASPGVMGVGLCLLPTASSLSAASGGDSVAWTVINSTLIALPGWLPFLNIEAAGVVVYRPDRFARQLSFDQGVHGPTPLMPSFAESQLRFMATQLSPILMQLGNLPIPAKDRVSSYTPEFRLFWRKNLDSFLTFVRGQAVIPEVSTVRVRDTSLRAITEQRERDASTFVAFEPEAAAAAEAAEQAAGEDVQTKRRHLEMESDDEEGEDMDADIGAEDDDDDDDNLPLSVHLELYAPKEQGEVGIIQPKAEPIPFPHPELEHSAVIGGTLPNESSIVDLGGDPNTVSTESSSSSEDSDNIIVYSTDRDPSPSNAASSEAREPPPPMDSRESVGQADIVAEPINAGVARLLREEEEDNVEETPRATTGGPAADQPEAGSTSTPSGSQQLSTIACIRST
ncbi:hypothetical protein C3L33_15731, partial [Rhododendron williamsianum]